jgi:hypothetical protein
VWNCLSPPIVSKKERFEALLVSRFIPEVTADDAGMSVKKQFFCTRRIKY